MSDFLAYRYDVFGVVVRNWIISRWQSAELIEESNDLLAWADRLLKARIPQA
jgi:hypothetical protein